MRESLKQRSAEFRMLHLASVLSQGDFDRETLKEEHFFSRRRGKRRLKTGIVWSNLASNRKIRGGLSCESWLVDDYPNYIISYVRGVHW